MKKPVIYFLHTVIIIVFIILIVYSAKTITKQFNGSFLFHLLDAFLTYGSFLGVIYLSYWLFIPQYLIKKEFRKFFLGLVVIVVGFTLYYNLTTLFFTKVLKVNFGAFVPGWWSAIAFYAIVLGMAGTFFRLFIQWLKDANDKIELEKQNFKSELALLKNQLNPHFLFNTLNNIDSLVIEKSPNASTALNKLSELMRYMVYDSERELVPLQDEINYIQNYVSLQKLRIPNEEIIKLSISGRIDNIHIAPMLFIPFIENAVKHSSLKDKPENKVEIKFDISENNLSFYCYNKIAVINKDKSSGVGLELVKKRLEMIYKDKYDLRIEKTEDQFIVTLNIKL